MTHSEKDFFRRYARQTVLPGIGNIGQERLQKAKILCVGVGGLGCPALLYLAGAGVGKLGLVDDDIVDVSNLQRQVLFATEDQGKPKTQVANKRLERLNPSVDISTYQVKLCANNALQICRDYDVIIDGTDNFEAKYLVNDAAVMLGLPVVYGSVSQYEGHVGVFSAKSGACYRCLYPYPPQSYVPNCAEAGVLGALTGIIGSIQAMEAIKLALSSDLLKPLVGRIVIINAADMSASRFAVAKNLECPVCSDNPSITELVGYEHTCESEMPGKESEITASELSSLDTIELIDVREEHEWELERIKGARNIPLSRIQQGERIDLPRDQLKVLYCVSGVRSQQALLALKENGFKNLKHLRGGIMQWKGPVSSGPA
ncbi:MAG: ThiF family adenylyltransferase [Bdellovibrionales bacterium]|nr:ThiF family adenylyltransferase [Bdellovibrionales bacterium]